MAWREVITEELTPDERCLELYGVAKEGLLKELYSERRQLRRFVSSTAEERQHRPALPVPGPTLRAMIHPEFRRYL